MQANSSTQPRDINTHIPFTSTYPSKQLLSQSEFEAGYSHGPEQSSILKLHAKGSTQSTGPDELTTNTLFSLIKLFSPSGTHVVAS